MTLKIFFCLFFAIVVIVSAIDDLDASPQDEKRKIGQRTCFCNTHIYNKHGSRIITEKENWSMKNILSCGEASLYKQKEKCEFNCHTKLAARYSNRDSSCAKIGAQRVEENQGADFIFKSSFSYSDCMGWNEREIIRYPCCIPKCKCSIVFRQNIINGVTGMGPEYVDKRIDLNVQKRDPFECGRQEDSCRKDCRVAASKYLGNPVEMLDMAVSELDLLTYKNGTSTSYAINLCSRMGDLPKPGAATYIYFDSGYGSRELLLIGNLCCLHIKNIPGVNLVAPFNCFVNKKY